MLSTITSGVIKGIEGQKVNIETCIGNGLPNFNIVGLASKSVIESRERIRSAIIHSGYDFPHGHITVNLSPASLNKNGSHLDLPIAIGVLSSTLVVNSRKAKAYAVIGELSLSGRIMPIDGVLPLIIAFREAGIKKVILPVRNVKEASMVEGISVIGVKKLEDAIVAINNELSEGDTFPITNNSSERIEECDYSDIKGQEYAKRALVVAAAGKHPLLMIGPPGCGKTMLAKRMPTILTPITNSELLETTIIHSVAGHLNKGSNNLINRPFRSPHHTISRAALLGGGVYPLPGELSLAHNGVLFLDEFCEFDTGQIEALRQPLEDHKIVISRQGITYEFPCRALVVMAANPCPCGFFGSESNECTCTAQEIARYRRRMSGPILDRIDLQLTMQEVRYEDLKFEKSGKNKVLDSETMSSMVSDAVKFSKLEGRDEKCGNISDKKIRDACLLGNLENKFLENAYDRLNLSPRSYIRTLKVARTIADIEQERKVSITHLAEALGYRCSEFDMGKDKI